MQLEEMLRILLYAQAAPRLIRITLFWRVRAERNNNFPAAHSNEAIYLAACDGGARDSLSFCLANAADLERHAARERERTGEIVEIFSPVFLHFGWRFYAANFA